MDTASDKVFLSLAKVRCAEIELDDALDDLERERMRVFALISDLKLELEEIDYTLKLFRKGRKNARY